MRALNKDIRVDQGLLDHPKYRRLKKIVGPLALEHLLSLWTWTAANRFKGVLFGVGKLGIEDAARWDGKDGELYSALVELGWLDVDEGGVVSVHDWEDHQGYVAKSEDRSKQAKINIGKRWVKGRNTDGIAPVYGTDTPNPNPSPTPNPEEKIQDATTSTQLHSSGRPHGDIRTGPSPEQGATEERLSGAKHKPRSKKASLAKADAEIELLRTLRDEWDAMVEKHNLTWKWGGANGNVLSYVQRDSEGETKLHKAIAYLSENGVDAYHMGFDWSMMLICRKENVAGDKVDRPAEILDGGWSDKKAPTVPADPKAKYLHPCYECRYIDGYHDEDCPTILRARALDPRAVEWDNLGKEPKA